MEKFKYDDLKNSADKAEQSLNKYLNEIQRSSCDKYGLAFNSDNRFSSMTVSLSLDSHLGYYGNSTCSTTLRTDEIFKDFFVMYLNNNIEEILRGTIRMIKKTAQGTIDKAIKEAEERLAALNAAKNAPPLDAEN